MANYYGSWRTNYFRVKNESAFKSFCKHLGSYTEVFSEERDGVKYHGMGGADSIVYYTIDKDEAWEDYKDKMGINPILDPSDVDDDVWQDFNKYCDENIDALGDISDDPFEDFINAIQPMLPENEALIYMWSGSEKLRYVVGGVTVITAHDVRNMETTDAGVSLAREMLDNPDFTTVCSY